MKLSTSDSAEILHILACRLVLKIPNAISNQYKNSNIYSHPRLPILYSVSKYNFNNSINKHKNLVQFQIRKAPKHVHLLVCPAVSSSTKLRSICGTSYPVRKKGISLKTLQTNVKMAQAS